ncbi:unnamed protein product [Danaus chrysippus]|uniref:(African queen) hypothetical protein n=1 Tax=Danaus chrysippus TaxID=151541 RepID=A0A8J2QXT9_9NEOP|nr:unnamed protein product [Danaus chrysippus]
MADTDTETLPNGNATLSAEEEERLRQRPADIDADVREMERRKRVEAIMSSKMFREELERVLDQQAHEGNDAPLLQRIREMVGGRLGAGSMRGPSCMLPINDIRGIEGVGYEKGEKILRCKLAAVYRLVDLFGWTQSGISGQITARLNTAVEQVLTTPRGLLPHEVTASSLVKLDMQGVVQDQGTTNFPVNVEGFSLHASVHAARPDLRCVLHVRSPAALAVSASKRRLMPLCGEAVLLGDVAYHAVPAGVLDNSERDKLVRALGPHSKVLVLAGGGALCCGETLEEAFYHARMLTAACDVQLRLASIPQDDLLVIDEDTRRQMYESSRKPPSDSSKWRIGGEEFEALMRMMDNAGYRTGHVYRHPLVKNDVPKPKSDVEVPPAVSSLGYLLEEEELYKQGLWKKGGKSGERTRWLNSPNVYQKVELLETGTSDPKRITKWVQDGSPAHSTPVKIDTLQFVPKNTNPKEFKQLQQQIKENRRADKISAGPQSHILEGVARDEARLLPEDAAGTHTGDHVILMGAASKGIIQRGYQHNATMYSAPYARNPFDHVTDTDIDEYKRVVERKQRGQEYDTDISESEALSAPQRSAPDTEDESREEQRVLRIETKQVPVMSQPEVVLSDDPSDFLNAERDHADRTRATRDPYLLSDDEVFLPSEPKKIVIVSRTTSSISSVARGSRESRKHEALSSNKRSLHKYSRTPNFDSTLQKYNTIPKCKTSLHHKLAMSNYMSCNSDSVGSRSSLLSIPSIDLDRCKIDSSRNRSISRFGNLYRTNSHSGFINSYIKDPEPNHYHLPKCNSCGTIIHSYSRYLGDTMRYFSCDNIANKGPNEIDFKPLKVKVKEDTVPVFKVSNNEFVDSQEFNEDNYLGDIGHSFSSDNKTVVEKITNVDKIETNLDELKNKGKENKDDIYRAVYVKVDEDGGSGEGDYHSFIDDMDFDHAVYDSPVKALVEKDIRDYSVPIDFYCEDYNRNDIRKQSPKKLLEHTVQTVLEPILEESKSSSDSCSDSNKTIIYNETVLKEGEENTNGMNNRKDLENDMKIEDLAQNESCIISNENHDTNKKTLVEEESKKGKRISSLSGGSSLTVLSLDSTVEFEKYELIADVVSVILKRFEIHINEKQDKETHEETIDLQTDEEDKNATFSITEMVLDYEKNLNYSNTELSESSETEVNYSQRIVEAVVYFIFDRAVYCCDRKNKKKDNKKRVVTVVDCEDIIYTTSDNILYLHESSITDGQKEDNSGLKDINEVPVDDGRMGLNESRQNDCSDSVCNEATLNSTLISENADASFTYYSQTDIHSEIIDDLLENSLKKYENPKDLSESFVADVEVMNTAFVDSDFYNRSSSPLRKVFEVCTESPIRRTGSINESICDADSPFVKKINVISMSQTVHSGGIKYWLSFDDNLVIEKPSPKSNKKFSDNKLPSFLVVDYDRKSDFIEKRSRCTDEAETSTSNYNTCESSRFDSTIDDKYIYNSRSRGNKILHSTWPPYDDTLFYRIISKFRLTESFDLSHLQKRCGTFGWFRVRRSMMMGGGEQTLNGDHSDAHQSTFSHSSKEGSPSKEVSTEDSPKKDKKKKKGLRTPSFLKKKKEKKKEKSNTPQPA